MLDNNLRAFFFKGIGDFKNVLVFIFEREREREKGRETTMSGGELADREGDTESEAGSRL